MTDRNERAIGESQLRGDVRPAAAGEPSIAHLLSSLIGDAQTLVRRELDLAKAEIAGEIDMARQGAIMLGAGIGAAAIGGIFLLVALAEALVRFDILERWLAYLIIGAVLAVVGSIALAVGIQRFKRVRPMPQESIDSLRQDATWLGEQVRSNNE
jgi:hypothetical protein